jgi:hypothetical protein
MDMIDRALPEYEGGHSNRLVALKHWHIDTPTHRHEDCVTRSAKTKEEATLGRPTESTALNRVHSLSGNIELGEGLDSIADVVNPSIEAPVLHSDTYQCQTLEDTGEHAMHRSWPRAITQLLERRSGRIPRGA